MHLKNWGEKFDQSLHKSDSLFPPTRTIKGNDFASNQPLKLTITDGNKNLIFENRTSLVKSFCLSRNTFVCWQWVTGTAILNYMTV